MIRIVLDDALLQAVDVAAKRAQVNRSALLREALRAHLRQLEVRAKERRDRDGYERLPDAMVDLEIWERAAVWPDE